GLPARGEGRQGAGGDDRARRSVGGPPRARRRRQGPERARHATRRVVRPRLHGRHRPLSAEPQPQARRLALPDARGREGTDALPGARRQVISAALVLFVAMPAIAGAQTPAPAASSEPGPLVDARALINQGKAGEAVQKLTALDASDPRVAQLLGVAYYHADQPVKAVETLQPIVDKLPADSIERREAVQVLGLSLYLAGRLPESIPYLEKTRAWAT